jgi:uncharacterized protein YnzC (UPF0291/DUF896 family)
MRWILTLFLAFPFWLYGQGYEADSLKVTELVQKFVQEHKIQGTDLQIVHKIIEVTHDEFLFVKVNRPLQKTWINDPSLVNKFKLDLEGKKRRFNELSSKRNEMILTEEEFKERRELIRSIFFDEHNLRVYENLIKHKNILAQDVAFVVSGSEAIEYGVRDGCTTMAHLFIALAKAAGMKDVRFIVCANVSEYLEACPQLGKPRDESVEIDGHMMAVVKIDGRWALVNCTHLEPYSLEDETHYEIIYEIDGEKVSPETLLGKVLKIPSYQRESFPSSQLLVVGIGQDKDDDLDVENHRALMNLSAGGDRESPICRWKISEKK